MPTLGGQAYNYNDTERREVCLDDGSGNVSEGYIILSRSKVTLDVIATRLELYGGTDVTATHTVVNCECNELLPPGG